MWLIINVVTRYRSKIRGLIYAFFRNSSPAAALNKLNRFIQRQKVPNMHQSKTTRTITALLGVILQKSLMHPTIIPNVCPLRLELVVVSVIRRNIGLETLPSSDADSEHCEKRRDVVSQK